MERRGETWSRGGKGAAFGVQKAVGGNTERRVMVEAAPAAPLIITGAEFLLQLLIVALDPQKERPGVGESKRFPPPAGTKGSQLRTRL
jgi:hypothetical protein